MKKFLLIFLFFLIFSCPYSRAEQTTLNPKNIGITEHVGKKISLDVPFVDEAGKKMVLGDLFKEKKPVILTLVYYECPDLCTFLLNGLLETLQRMSWAPGKEFTIVSVSINPHDTPELASAKKKAYLEKLGKPGAEKGWKFLTGAEKDVKKLADEVGFGYAYVPEEKQYAHASALFILNPDGRIIRYLYGVKFTPLDLKLALLESRPGPLGSLVRFFARHFK